MICATTPRHDLAPSADEDGASMPDAKAAGDWRETDSAPSDAVLSNIALPLEALYYPLGFPLKIFTNSSAVFEAAQQSWGLFKPEFSCPALVLRLGVVEDPNASPELPSAPTYRLQGHLLSNIADANNFIISDLNQGFSFGWITQAVAQNTLYLRYHLLEAAALCMISALYATPLHSACVAPSGHGMLLCGESGAGKSSLAFAGARSGWTFISDDATYLVLNRSDRKVIGNCHQVRLRDTGVQLFPELHGRPVTPRAAGKPSIELPTSDVHTLATASSANIESIVFLNRRDVAATGLFPFPRNTALSWFQQSPLKTPQSAHAHESAIRNLLDAEILELRYTDLDWAIDRLDKLALTGR